MELIRATAQNFDTLFELITQFYSYFDYPFDKFKHRKVVENFMAIDHLGSVWLIQKEKESIGYIALTYGFSFEFQGRDAFIDEFFVHENYRNLGIGRWALRKIQEKMNELGLNALHLQTESYNKQAKKLYESVDFKDLKRSSLTFLRKGDPSV
jgi:ribosomal protein S18 acetylase RimI-like enzyme